MTSLSPDTINNQINELPEPSSDAKAHSLELIQRIIAAMEAKGGKLTFHDYMQYLLYEPGLGYYSAGMKKFGGDGDFITAPELSPIFSRCFAMQLVPLLQQLPEKNILEFGAGSGVMAADILLELEQQQSLPDHYYILDLSADLIERQQQTINDKAPHLLSRVSWLHELPDEFVGVVIANELLDAMPIHLLKLTAMEKDNITQERYVSYNGERFVWQDGPLSNPELETEAKRVREIIALTGETPEEYITEVNLNASNWVKTISEKLKQGAVILFDYGHSSQDYYHAQRSNGTLMCHYQHRAHPDPLVLCGLQDVTSYVDFTAVAQAAVDNGMQVPGYTTQGYFLMGGGLMQLSQEIDPLDVKQQTEFAHKVRQLTLPDEMGEKFKAILLSKNMDALVPAFMHQDMRHRL